MEHESERMLHEGRFQKSWVVCAPRSLEPKIRRELANLRHRYQMQRAEADWGRAPGRLSRLQEDLFRKMSGQEDRSHFGVGPVLPNNLHVEKIGKDEHFCLGSGWAAISCDIL